MKRRIEDWFRRNDTGRVWTVTDYDVYAHRFTLEASTPSRTVTMDVSGYVLEDDFETVLTLVRNEVSYRMLWGPNE